MSHKVTPSEIGMIRIYMKPSDKATDGPRSFWTRKPLYRQLVVCGSACKKDPVSGVIGV